MRYIRIELKKIFRSPLVLIATVLPAVLTVVLMTGLVIKGRHPSSLQFVSLALGNLVNLGIFQLAVAAAGGTAFAADRSYGTLSYIRIRSVSFRGVIAARITASLVYVLVVAGIVFVLSLICGFGAFEAGPLTDESGEPLGTPWARVALFYGFTSLNQVFILSLTRLTAAIIERHTSVILTSYALYVLMLIFVPEQGQPFTPIASFSLKGYLSSPTIDLRGIVTATGITGLWAVGLFVIASALKRRGDDACLL